MTIGFGSWWFRKVSTSSSNFTSDSFAGANKSLRTLYVLLPIVVTNVATTFFLYILFLYIYIVYSSYIYIYIYVRRTLHYCPSFFIASVAACAKFFVTSVPDSDAVLPPMTMLAIREVTPMLLPCLSSATP